MKNIQLNVTTLLLALLLALVAAPASATTDSLGVAGEYNAFVFGSYSSAYSDIEGSLAAGGSGTFTGYSINSSNVPDSNGNGLVVGGSLSFNNGQIYGNAQVGGAAATSSFNVVGGSLYANNPNLPVDFTTEKTNLQGLSTSLSQIGATGSTVSQYGGISLTGDMSTGLQVFNVNGSDLLNANSFNLIDVNSNATVLINVSGSVSGFTNMGFNLGSADSSKVLFNFYEATDLTMSGVGVWGSVLAAWADVDATNGQFNGTLIANSFNGNMELHTNTFTGDLPTPTPLPGSFVLMGSGLLGLLAIRRKKS